MHTFHKLLTPVGSGVPRILGLFYSFKNFSQVIRQKIFLEKSWLYFHIDNKYSYAQLRSCTYDTQQIVCCLIVSLRQFDSKGIIIMYYVASEGLCYDVLMTKLRLGTFFQEQN